MKTIKEGDQPHYNPHPFPDSGENRDGHALKALYLYAFPMAVNFELIPVITKYKSQG